MPQKPNPEKKNILQKYNAGVNLARSYQDKGKVLIIAPDDTCGVGTLSREKSALFKIYEKGRHDAEKIIFLLICQSICAEFLWGLPRY